MSNKRIVSAEIPEHDEDIMVIKFSDGSEKEEVLFYPEGERVQLDSSIVGFHPNNEDWKIIDEEIYRFSSSVLGIKRPQAKSAASRQASRNQRIIDAGLVQRKVVGHPDDFEAIRAYAVELYKKRNIDFK
ncbi:hypothetical protein KO527_05295 [Pseudoalteromonas sp. C2R02]|uniref:hypothetical protein n=1 Tax=Pseudoalteromonas sp. C2R02 TaxID=2841565 RepID=UPI001C08B758|nr:hypothetical protein [Pseudoalteromonas sp. C2R02]MBU2968763.1 hypothetical protein [Pseudoalteromonas sp. C2R02]